MDFYEAVSKRRSVRSFLPDQVPDEALGRALEAAMLSPSAQNTQPWRFVVMKGAARDELCRRVSSSSRLLADFFPDISKEYLIEYAARFLSDLGGAPVVVVVTLPKCQEGFDRKVALVALGGAVAQFQTALAAEGIGSVCVTAAVWIEESIRNDLQLPDDELAVIIPVGFADEELGPRPPRESKLMVLDEWPG